MQSLPGTPMTAIAKITAKGQATISRDIRTALHVGAGVRRVQPLDPGYLLAGFPETALPFLKRAVQASPRDAESMNRKRAVGPKPME